MPRQIGALLSSKTCRQILNVFLCLSLVFPSLTPLIHNVSPTVSPVRAATADLNNLQNLSQPHYLNDDDLPEGVRLNTDALTTAAAIEPPRQPNALANPISISRRQVKEDSTGHTVITFRITNHQPPLDVPQPPAGATITETIEVIANSDPTADPNTIRNILLVDELTSAATFVSASTQPEQQGATYAWRLDDIPPLSSITATLTLQTAAAGGSFIDLDTGAQVWGTLQGRSVTAQAWPAQLAPNNLSQWLVRTVDADTADEEMLAKAAELGQDPLKIFEYVRSLGYESYQGSLRGTRGTLWSEAGNSIDQASLLIAMLRASNIPARYRHGSLSTARAQALILAMFPASNGTIGHIPPEVVVSDPANDSSLLADTKDHWWVEAYLPGQGWQDLDPSFAEATVGQRFVDSVANDGTDKIAEVPDSLRHKVTMKLKIETYTPLTANLPGGLPVSYPLDETFNTVELVGQPVTLAHFVDSKNQGGLVFSTITNKYIPYFIIGDRTVDGSPYQDLISNFPLGQSVITGLWWIFEVQDSAGNVETYERELADRLGFETRQSGGAVSLTLSDTTGPIIQDLTLHQMLVGVGAVPMDALRDRFQPFAVANQDLFRAKLELMNQNGSNNEEQLVANRDILTHYRIWATEALHTLNILHYTKSDYATDVIAASLLVKEYPKSPRLIIASQSLSEDGNLTMSLDLLKDDIFGYAYPGQNVDMPVAFQGTRGVMESYIEGLAIQGLTGQNPATTHAVFEKLSDFPDTSVALITSENLSDLDTLNISAEAKGRIFAAVGQGKIVTVPSTMIQLNGVVTIGWWEKDPDTGITSGVMENGQHAAAVQYSALLNFSLNLAAFEGGFAGSFFQTITGFIAEVFKQVNQQKPVDMKELFKKLILTTFSDTIALAISEAVNIKNPALQNAAKRLITHSNIIITNCINENCTDVNPFVQAIFDDILGVWVKYNTGVDISSAISFGRVSGKVAAAVMIARAAERDPPLPDSLIHDVSFESQTQNSINKNLSVSSSYPIGLLQATLSTSHLSASVENDAATFYAPAVAGMGVGGDATAFGVANFTNVASFQANDAQLSIGPASGTVQVGGQTLNVPNGIGLAGYSGPVALTEIDSTTDQIELSGNNVSFFTLDLSQATSTINPVNTTNFTAQIRANFDDTFKLYVAGPTGWDISLTDSGTISAKPPAGATAGDYTILVTAQSQRYPHTFVSATHQVTVNSYQGLTLSISPDNLITVPWGDKGPNALPGNTNNGQMQLTGAAFTIDLTNHSNTAQTFDLSVAGLPPGWLLISDQPQGQTTTSIRLPAGATGQVGFYISPTGTALPPAGTNYGFTVSASVSGNPALTASDAASFTVPSLPFSQLSIAPIELFSSAGQTASFEVGVRNVGNATGTFPLSIDLPLPSWNANFNASLTLDAGQLVSQTITLQIPAGVAGQDYPVRVLSPSGNYTQTATINVRLAGPQTSCVNQVTQDVNQLGEDLVSGALISLGRAVENLENDPTNLIQRDKTAAAIQSVVRQLVVYPNLNASTELTNLAQTMITHTEPTELQADLAMLCTILTNLPPELTIFSQYRVSSYFTPGYQAALPNQPISYTLHLANQGTLTASYAVTVTGPGLAPLPPPFTQDLSPGQTFNLPLNLTAPAGLGNYQLTADIAALGVSPPIQRQTQADLKVVDAFIRVLQVEADPPFVETGSSSTDVSIEVANIANIYRPVIAQTQILDPSGTPVWNNDLPLDITTGPTRSYPLATVDTSGWVAGVYTISVNLLDAQNTLIPDGRGYGHLSVGQGLWASQAVFPSIVAPGTAVVTTTITTSVRSALLPSTASNTANSSRQWAKDNRLALAKRRVITSQRTIAEATELALSSIPSISSILSGKEDDQPSSNNPDISASHQASTQSLAVQSTTGIVRYEEDDPALLYNGLPLTATANSTWDVFSYSRASRGYGASSLTAGDTASLTFEGTWVGLGFMTRAAGGHAEVFIDGISQGIVDTYSRVDDVKSVYYNNLSAGTHTISVTVLGTHNPFATDERVRLDYIDVWDGSTMSTGLFEQDDSRVYRSNNWRYRDHTLASGGDYFRAGSNVWFPFTGDSITFQTLAFDSGGLVDILIDGQSQGIFSQYSRTATTQTFSFNNLGSGAHILQIKAYRGEARVDAFTTPGSPPFYEPPAQSSFTRYEEDDPALRYNGVPLTATATSWGMSGYSWGSRGYATWSRTVSDTVSLTFDGTWVGLGFVTRSSGGQAEVFIDGISQGIVDTYSRVDDVKSVYYPNLSPGQHTLTVEVLGTGNGFASNSYVYIDYIDVWDGSTMPTGLFEQDDSRVYRSNNWRYRDDTLASGGNYFRAGSNVWFPFTGDSITFQTLAFDSGGLVDILIDGQSQGIFNQYSRTATTQTFSFNNLGSGAHILQIKAYRGEARVDAFTTPGSPPFYEPPAQNSFTRYEEDDPALRYNGVPIQTTNTSWDVTSYNWSSRGYGASSLTAGDTVSLSFEGTWVGLGFVMRAAGGQAEVFIDGISQGIVDTYSRVDDVKSVYYNNLSAGTHTISVTVLGTRNPFATHDRVRLDYIDVWDGSTMPTGLFEQDDSRVYLSSNWRYREHTLASGGNYFRAGSNVWFPFTGDSITFQILAFDSGGLVDILIDGQSQGIFSQYSRTATTQTFSFNNLGSGAHILQIKAYRGEARVDAFTTPGSPPFYEPPAQSSFTRYEEDDPALRYNGVPLATTATSWNIRDRSVNSAGYNSWSETVGDTVSLTFTGTWVSLGFLAATSQGQAEIFIDGISQGLIDNYSPETKITSYTYPNLSPGTHTVSVTVLGTRNVNSTGDYINLDYIDTWDGTLPPKGLYEQDDRQVYLSNDWRFSANSRVSSGTYLEDGSNAWFHFVGDSITYIAVTDQNSAQAEIFIDGVSQGIIDMVYGFSRSPVPFRFDNLGDGPHIMQVTNVSRAGVDGFDTSDTPFNGVPMVEWFVSDLGDGSEGVLTTAAAGDINNDGLVELAVTSSDNVSGTLSVFRGDGIDTGAGSPLIWSAKVGFGDTPALADLTGDNLAEIVVGSDKGVFAFHHDGTLYWFSDVVLPHFAKYRIGIDRGPWGGASIANLDNDKLPEIVVVGHLGVWPNNDVQQQRLVVFKADGQIASSYDLPVKAHQFTATPPLLADLTGDGQLDILVGQQNTLHLLNYSPGVPDIIWTRTVTPTYLPNTIWAEGTWGSPAVADVDGTLPGGDPGPEIVMVWDTLIELLDEDGKLLWSYPTGGGVNPGSASIADTDGDGEVEIITVMKRPWRAREQDIYVLNADGSLLWTAEVEDSTTSASGVSVLDLENDGTWEVVWNGHGTGLTIFRGSDGEILFNEPLINSGTIVDYPIISDVDGDNHAEIVAGDAEGIYVIGNDFNWGPSRPLWNQYNYNMTNINDDLTVPLSEPDSWTIHNTYRTQTPLNNPAPVYQIDLAHTVTLNNVEVLTDTFSSLPNTPAPTYRWAYQHYWYEPTRTTSFASQLADMQPGEVRQISEGTEITYQLSSGSNRLTLPPLFVAAEHIVALGPSTKNVAAGSLADYTVTLSNPGLSADVYTLTLNGLPEGWATLPATITLAAGQVLTLPLTLNIPAEAEPTDYTLMVGATNSSGGVDKAGAKLSVSTLSQLTVTPNLRQVNFGQVADYTVNVTNLSGADRTYRLAVAGFNSQYLNISPNLFVPAAETISTTLTLTATAPADFYPLQVTASYTQGSQSIEAADSTGLVILNEPTVAVTLNPAVATAGPASPAVYDLTVTNLGDTSDTYDLSLQVPPGWSYQILANDASLQTLTLAPAVFNSATVQVLVIPPAGTPPGQSNVTAIATSQNVPAVSGSAAAGVDVAGQGVTVSISPDTKSLGPTDVGAWNVRVMNTGTQAGTFDLTASGIVAGTAQFSSNSVSLGAGQSTTVQLTAGPLDFPLPTAYDFAVTAQAQNNPDIFGYDTAQVTFDEYQGVEISLTPDPVIQTSVYTAVSYLALITNTGNVDGYFSLDVNTTLTPFGFELELDQLYIPARMTAGILLRVQGCQQGSYDITAQVASNNGAVSDNDTATLIIEEDAPPAAATFLTYLPIIIKPGNSQNLASSRVDTQASLIKCQPSGEIINSATYLPLIVRD